MAYGMLAMTADQPAGRSDEVRRDELETACAFGPFRLFPARQLLIENGKPVPLGTRAFELLVVLTEHAGEIVSNEHLMSRVWRGLFVDDSNVRVHVAGLRRALRDGKDGQRYIVNIPGRGYSFVAPVQVVPAESEPPIPAAARPDTQASLPRPLTRLIGRAELVDAVGVQLTQRRFVTLVGPGGIGKTSVALAVAHQIAASYPDGVCFIDFSSIRDPDLVPASIAAAFGLAVPSRDATPAIIAHLAQKTVLLVLDNCEHVIETAANAAEHVFTSAAGVHVLCTSREPLRAAGERVHRLPPLESPSRSAGLTAQEALTFPGVQLFVERVAANLNGFQLSDADAPVVAEICQKLDGIALAIELAAGRVAAFGVQELADRLGDRFRLLTSGRRTALPRHQTLAATLDWSYELLPPAEQTLLRRLSIFAGEFSLEAAIAVIAGAEKGEVVGHIADLVSKSLVVADWNAEGVRYRLLETTRLYAAEKLRGGAEGAKVREAHAIHVHDLFKMAEQEAETLPTPAWRAKYAAQIDNLRAALDWAGSPDGDPTLFAQLLVAAVPLWVHLSLMGECRVWVQRGLAVVDGEDRAALDTRMRLSAALGWSLMYSAARTRDIGSAWAATLELADKLENNDYRLRAIWGVWIGKLNHGELDAALDLAGRMLDAVQGSSNQADIMTADRLMATTLHFRGDQGNARVHIERMFARYARAAAQPRIARFHVDQQVTARYFRARILWLQGYVDQALQAMQQNVQESEPLGNALSFASVLGQAACPLSLLTGDLAAAGRYGAMLLDHSERHALHLWNDWARCFGGLVAIKQGDVRQGLDVMATTFEKAGESRLLPRYMLPLGEYTWELGRSGRLRLGLETIDEMIARCGRTEERWYQPELLRLRGELLLLDGDVGSQRAEAHFQQALDLASRQGARSWQLRAAVSLARSSRNTSGADMAKSELSRIYATFQEGLSTSDLLQAADILQER